MRCLRSLNLIVLKRYDRRDSQSQYSTLYSTPKNPVSLLQLTRIHYTGATNILERFHVQARGFSTIKLFTLRSVSDLPFCTSIGLLTM